MVEGGVPVYAGKGDCTKKVAALSAFWEQVVMSREVGQLEFVTLAYDGLVVVRWKGRAEQLSTKAGSGTPGNDPRQSAVPSSGKPLSIS
jgi:hypothetical protein